MNSELQSTRVACTPSLTISKVIEKALKRYNLMQSLRRNSSVDYSLWSKEYYLQCRGRSISLMRDTIVYEHAFIRNCLQTSTAIELDLRRQERLGGISGKEGRELKQYVEDYKKQVKQQREDAPLPVVVVGLRSDDNSTLFFSLFLLFRLPT